MSIALKIPFPGFSIEYEMSKDSTVGTSSFGQYLEELCSTNVMSFTQGKFYFSDEIWDFSPYITTNIPTMKSKFNFSSTPDCYKKDIKYFALSSAISGKRKIQSVREQVMELSLFFRFAQGQNCYSIHDISPGLVDLYFKSNDFIATRTQRLINLMYQFFTFYDSTFNTKLFTKEMRVALDTHLPKFISSEINSRKLENIPESYYKPLVESSINILDSCDPADIKHKGTACIVILLSQTGIRIGEILNLYDNCINPTTLSTGEKASFLTYDTWKRESGNNTESSVPTFVTPLAKKAINTLRELYREKRIQLNTNYLYLGGNGKESSDYPLDSGKFSKIIRKYYYYLDKYFPTIDLPETSFTGLLRSKTSSFLGVYGERAMHTITYPDTRQFRVHLCTELYNKGIPLEYIRRFMGHLSSTMEGYYVRPNIEFPQEDMQYSMDVFKQIVTGEVELLGGKPGLMDKINEFIEAGNYRIYQDTDEICHKLSEKIPVSQKSGGVCIKSCKLRECSADAKTDEFYCAYDVCPNIYHFYYMISTKYKQATDLIASISFNEKNGYFRQAQKEKNKLNTIAASNLIPELDSLKRMMARHGEKHILELHPDLQYIVVNYDSVYTEAKEWAMHK